jgi:hypothetical protein
MTLAEVGNRELIWVENAGGKWAFDLRAGSQTIGHLSFETESGSRAIGEIGRQRWRFEQIESIHPHVVVREENESEPLAIFSQRWTGAGFVKFRNGVQYYCSRSHVWSTTYCFRRESRKASVCVSQEAPSKRGSRVTVCGEAASLPETPVLVLLGWFVEILMAEKLAETSVAW